MSVEPRSQTWDEVARNYAAEIAPEAHDLAREIVALLAQAGLTPPRRLLETGCGSGHISLELRRAGYATDLLDFSPVALEKAAAAYARALGDAAPSCFIAGDLLKLSEVVAPRSYDLVWNSGVLEHFSRDRLNAALAQMATAAREAVLFIVPNPESLVYLAYREKMLEGQRWDVGVEFLRSDYEVAVAAAGLRMAQHGFCGKEFTRAWLAHVIPSAEDRRWFEKIVSGGLAERGSAYLQYFLCVPAGAAAPMECPGDDRDALDRTYYVDALATANGALATLRKVLDRRESNPAQSVVHGSAPAFDLIAQRDEELQALFGALAQSPLAEVAAPAKRTWSEPPAQATIVNIVSYLFFDRDGRQLMGGGAERYLVELSRLIRELGYELHIYQCANTAWDRTYDGVPVHGLPTLGDNRLLNSSFHEAATVGALTIYSAFDVAEPFCHPRALGISHGVFWDNPSYQTPEAAAALRRALANCMHIVSVDANTINWVRATHGDLADRFTYIPNFVDTEAFHPQPRPADGRCVVLYPRRLYRPRGFWLLADIIPALLARYANMEFEFVGQADAEEAQRVAELQKQFGGRVRHEFVEPDQMAHAYQRADITVIPTVASEGTSLSCLEALACGNAVIVTDVGGLPELVSDGFNGQVISPTAEALVEALERLAADPEKRRRLGENARRSAEAYGKAAWQERWRQTLRRFLPVEPTATDVIAGCEVVHPVHASVIWETLPEAVRRLLTGLAARGLVTHVVEDVPNDVERREADGVRVVGSQTLLHPARTVLYLHDPRSYLAALEYERPVVVYHIVEDPQWRSAAGTVEPEPGYRQCHQILLREADVVLTADPALAARYVEVRPDVVLLRDPAGADSAQCWSEQVLCALRAAPKRGCRLGRRARREVWDRIAALRAQSRVWRARWKELTTWTERLHADHQAKCEETSRLWAQYQELTDRAQTLAQSLQARSDELSRERQQQAQRLQAKSEEADRIWRAYCDEKAKAEASATQVEQQAAELRWLTEKNRALEARLDGILNSTGWRFMQVLYGIRFFLFPRGSLREQAARRLMHAQRRLRYYFGGGAAAAARARAAQSKKAAKLAPKTQPGAAAAETTGTGVRSGVPGLVSVILPVYNQANLLRDSIESVLAQTYPDFELIVINDGSADGVEQVLAEYRGHPKVRALTQTNQKLPKALSNGFEFARGEFWTWTSADNLMEPQQLERQVAFLRAHPEAHMVYCDYLAIDDHGAPLTDPSFRPHNRRQPDAADIHIPRDTTQLNTVQDNFIGACFMYRGWTGHVLGDYAPNLGVEDYDYWMRMNDLFAIRHIGTDEPLYRYRVHDNTLNARAAEHRILERVQRLMKYDEERRAAYARPWTIYADVATRTWLGRLDLRAHSLREWTGTAPPREQKSLLLMHADTLPALAKHGRPEGCAVLAWFDDHPCKPYEYASLIQRLTDGCFATDATTRARLELHTRSVWEALPGRELLDAAFARANNDLFYRTTTPAADRARQLPRVLRPAAQPLRVLLQADHFLQGGLEQVILDIAGVLAAQGTDIRILSLGREGPAAVKAGQQGVPYERLGDGDRVAAYRAYLRAHQFDVISAHYSLFGADIAAELGIPFVQTVHNTYVWLGEADCAAHRAADAHTRAYCCVSNAAALYADVKLHLSRERMVVMPNGIDAEAMDAAAVRLDRAAERRTLGFGEDDFVFLNVASIYPPKCQHLLLAALQQARAGNPRIKVAMLGRAMDEPYADRVRRQASELGLEDSVRWLGYQFDPQRFYYVCDGFVLPSFIEGWSLALAEALYAGLPIVASDVGSARDVLGGPNHFLISPPFGSIVEVDGANWGTLLSQEHPAFVAALADALVAAAGRTRTPSEPELARRINRRSAYQGYARLFEWLAAGGDAAAARSWVWALHGVGDPLVQAPGD